MPGSNSAIEDYKKGVIPHHVDFSHPEWVKAIQTDIAELESTIKSLIKTDSIIGGGGVLLLWLQPCLSLATTATYLFFYRNKTKEAIEKQIDKLAQLFMKITPPDTHHPIVLRLTETLAPLISDEKILKNWMRRDFSQQSIDIANTTFKNILATQGFLQVQNFDTWEKARQARETDRQTYSKQPMDLLTKNLRYTLYGKGKMSELLSTSKRYEYHLRGHMAMALGYTTQSPTN